MQVAAELYGLPPERYTAARNARAKGLRKEQPELAAQVAKLPKPTAAAAAINRVARDEPSEVRALVPAAPAARRAKAKRDDGREARREAVKAAQARLAAAKRDARDATAARKEAERALEAARKAEQAATAAVEEADATLGEARSRA